MLLDTNALLWLHLDHPRLGSEARKRILASGDVYFSSVSTLEIVIKHMLGRIPLPGGDRFPEVFIDAGLLELPFTSKHANRMLDDPELCRHDPFDRQLLAQATVEGMQLLTADRVLLGLGREFVVDATL